MFTYGWWLYHELKDLVGVGPGKHRGDREDAYITLDTPNYGSFKVKVSSLRLELFRDNPTCVTCGKVGALWALEGHHKNEAPHLNLYYVHDGPVFSTSLGKEQKIISPDGLILMTKDHIVPKSKGGPTHITNLQVMCTICNGNKGDTLPQGVSDGQDQGTGTDSKAGHSFTAAVSAEGYSSCRNVEREVGRLARPNGSSARCDASPAGGWCTLR